MAGTLVLTTLSDGTNSTSATNAIRGSAKAWVNINGANGSIRDSYNVSSVTKTTTGTYIIYFTNAMNNNNYSIYVSSSAESTNDWNMCYATDYGFTRTTSAFSYRVSKAHTTTPTDVAYVNCGVFSS